MSLDPEHAFDGKLESGRRCSCAHDRTAHVQRYEPGRPLRTLCRGCADR